MVVAAVRFFRRNVSIKSKTDEITNNNSDDDYFTWTCGRRRRSGRTNDAAPPPPPPSFVTPLPQTTTTGPPRNRFRRRRTGGGRHSAVLGRNTDRPVVRIARRVYRRVYVCGLVAEYNTVPFATAIGSGEYYAISRPVHLVLVRVTCPRSGSYSGGRHVLQQDPVQCPAQGSQTEVNARLLLL